MMQPRCGSDEIVSPRWQALNSQGLAATRGFHLWRNGIIDISTTWGYLFKAVALGFSAAVIPGPFQIYMLSQALRYGWRRGAVTALAPLVSDGPIILVVLLLLARLPRWTLEALQIAGGAFVLYLAWAAWRALRATGQDADLSPTTAPSTTLLQAATLNMLSPVVYIFWATVSGPLLVQGWQRAPIEGLAFVACFYGAMILTSEVLIIAVCLLQKLHTSMTRVMLALSVLLMLGLGLAQVWGGISGLRGSVG